VADRRVCVSLDTQGTAQLSGLNLPPDRAAAADNFVDRLARAAKSGGDGRTIDQLRTDAMLDLLTGLPFQLYPSIDPLTAAADHQAHAETAATTATRAEAFAQAAAIRANATKGTRGRAETALRASVLGIPAPTEPGSEPARDTANVAATEPRDVDPPDLDPPDLEPPNLEPWDLEPPDPDPSDPGPPDLDPSDPGPPGLKPSDLGPWDRRPPDTDPHDVDPPEFGSADFGPADFQPAAVPPAGASAGKAARARLCTCGGVRPAARRGVVDIQVKLSTLLDLDQDSGWIPGWGPVIADIARQVAFDDQTRPAWAWSVTDESGQLLHHGYTARRAPAAERAFIKARDRTCRAP
jgi:hypothetical protein